LLDERIDNVLILKNISRLACTGDAREIQADLHHERSSLIARIFDQPKNAQ
jgi:hypothetical protein